jgi:isocitrate lyase
MKIKDIIKEFNHKVGHDIMLTQPNYTLAIDTPGELDWYKIGQHYPTLSKMDPHEYGQGESDMVMTFSTKQEMENMKDILSKMGAKFQDISLSHVHPEVHDENQ